MCAASFCKTFHQSVVARALYSAVVWRLSSTSKSDNMGSTNWSERLHMSLAVTWRHLCQWWTAGHWTNCSHHRQSFTPTSSDFRGLAALILQLTHPAPLPQWMSQDLILAILYPAVQKLIFLLQITPLLHKNCIYNIIVFFPLYNYFVLAIIIILLYVFSITFCDYIIYIYFFSFPGDFLWCSLRLRSSWSQMLFWSVCCMNFQFNFVFFFCCCHYAIV